MSREFQPHPGPERASTRQLQLIQGGLSTVFTGVKSVL
jgi:hypothetical protein